MTNLQNTSRELTERPRDYLGPNLNPSGLLREAHSIFSEGGQARAYAGLSRFRAIWQRLSRTHIPTTRLPDDLVEGDPYGRNSRKI